MEDGKQALDAALPDRAAHEAWLNRPQGGVRCVLAGRESAPGGALYRGSGSSLLLLVGELPGVDPDRL